MANNPLPVARSRVSLGSATTTWDEVTASGDDYVQIGRIRSIGGFGDTFQEITVDEVNDGRTRKAKGTANAGNMEIVCSRDATDEGQIAMIAAAESQAAFNFMVELPNGDGTYHTYYISALVMSQNLGLGGPNDTQTITFNLGLNEALIEVEAGSSS
ncbi:hypothetical protein [Mesorhizobium sp. CAU 1741]|uniref:hypothetical protein n=1 Tax=Mesorhizobium sp. CAU 1741 TaxID=3140366 RepID=UPI00325AC257